MRILYLALLFSNLIASNADSLFVRGNYYFDNEKYVQAARSYERLLNSVEHADLYYNLGNSYYRMGEVGHAVWAYEKGLQFEPRNRDIKHNLEITNTRVKDRIDFPDEKMNLLHECKCLDHVVCHSCTHLRIDLRNQQ